MNEVSVGKETRVIKYNQEKGKKMKETVSSVVTLEEWLASGKYLLEHCYIFIVRGLSNSFCNVFSLLKKLKLHYSVYPKCFF